MGKRLHYLAIVSLLFAAACAGAAWCLDGTVTTTDGKPIAKAKVWVYHSDKGGTTPTLLYTDEAGKFSFTPPESASYIYLAAAEGYAFAARARGAGQNDAVDLKLWPEQKINGQVVDAEGRPVAGTRVNLRSFSSWGGDGSEAASCSLSSRNDFPSPSISDADGRFTLLHVPDPARLQYMSLDLSATARGRALVECSYNRPGGDIKIIQPPACSVSGTIYLPGKAGPAPEGTSVAVVFCAAGAGMQSRQATLDKNGRFIFKDLPPGPADLMLPPQDERWNKDCTDIEGGLRKWALPALVGVELAPERPRSVEMVMVPGAVVRGKILDKTGGKPVTGGTVSIAHIGRPESTEDEAAISKNGEFMLRVAPGSVAVSVRYCKAGDSYINFDEQNESPVVEFTVADGEDKTDIALTVNANANGVNSRAAMNAPPADLELKPGIYSLAWDPELTARGDGTMGVMCADAKAKAKMRKLPALKSKKPLCMGVKLDGAGDAGLLMLIFDESRGTGQGFDTLYVDANRNRDLTDDRPYKWRIKGDYYSTPWAAAMTQVGVGSERVEKSIKLKWHFSNGRPYYMMRRGGWSGTIDSSKGPLSTICLDANLNGRCDDRLSGIDPVSLASDGLDWGDCIFADTNGLGKAYPTQWGPHALMQGAASVFGEKGYIVTANSTGDKITVAPYEGQMGKLCVRGVDIAGLDGQASSLQFTGKDRLYYYMQSDGQPISLPVGKYRLGGCGIELKKDDKNVTVSGRMDKIVEVKAGEQTTVTIGGKPTLTVLPAKWDIVFGQNEEESIEWGISVGDSLKGVTIGGGETIVPKAAFDESDKMIDLKPIGGG